MDYDEFGEPFEDAYGYEDDLTPLELVPELDDDTGYATNELDEWQDVPLVF